MSPRQSIVPVFVPHLGCPHMCVFCNQNRISGAAAPATAETVKNAIETAAALTPPESKRQLAFYGGSFTAIPAGEQEALLAAAQPFLTGGVISSIRLSTRPDAIDGVVLARLKKYGVETIELGAQSMDDGVLIRAGRGHSAKDVEDASALIKNAGFKLILQMMTGLPGDTAEKSIETARKIIALSPDGARIYPTVIVRDTELYSLWKRGEYAEHTVKEAVSLGAELLPMFEEAGIPIIRFGLNPTEELSGGDAVGGAYHPALGELVQSRVFLNRAKALLREKGHGEYVKIGVNSADISKMTGQHRGNIEALMGEFHLKGLKIVPAAVEKGEISLISLADRDKM